MQKNQLLKEMEEQSAKALEQILSMENENKELQKDYEWMKQELEEA